MGILSLKRSASIRKSPFFKYRIKFFIKNTIKLSGIEKAMFTGEISIRYLKKFDLPDKIRIRYIKNLFYRITSARSDQFPASRTSITM